MLDVIEAGNKAEVNNRLAIFRDRGRIRYDLVLSIPVSERIPMLIADEGGRGRVSAVLSASLISAMENLNLRVGLSEDQIFELAEAIIDESSEDFLSIEDVLLFLRNLITGKAGKIYDRMDFPTFFEMFEKYRQERYTALRNIREEQHVQNKSYGNPERYSDMSKEEERNAFHEAMKGYVKFIPNDNAVSGDKE